MSYKITDDCIMCGTCKEECPVEAINEGDPKYVIDPRKMQRLWDLCRSLPG